MGKSENSKGPKRHHYFKRDSPEKNTHSHLYLAIYYYTMNSMFGSKSLWAKFWLISTLFNAICLANPILEEDTEDSGSLGDDEISAVNLFEYLQRLAAARNSLNNENQYMVSDMLRDRRRGSMAENNFQLRVRKRGSDFGHQPSLRNSAESNFRLRVRKDFLDRLRSSPQIRSSAEDNFQLRVRRKPSSAERNFQLRVRRSDPNSNADTYQRSLRQTLLDKIRDRRFNPLSSAGQNFQLRVRRSPEITASNSAN